MIKLKSFIIAVTFILLSQNAAGASIKKRVVKGSVNSPVQTSLIVDAKTGKILHAQNAHIKIYPASLTKVMTLYMLFEALESGKLKMEDNLYVSSHATTPIPLKLFLKPGETISVRDAMLGIIVRSANDASIVVAERLAGSEERFAKLMTKKAKQLGMKNTSFANSHGLHHQTQMTTAMDLAKLSIAIRRDFPQYYDNFSKTSFTFRGKEIRGHNRLTANYPGAEGLKTGFTNPAGCNLITSATNNGKSLIGVVTGRKSAVVRDQKMASLLDEHFGIKRVIVKTAKKTMKIKKSKTKLKIASNKR